VRSLAVLRDTLARKTMFVGKLELDVGKECRKNFPVFFLVQDLTSAVK